MNTTVTIQHATITELEHHFKELGVIVEAWAMPEPATEPCSNDELDGKGCCYGPTGDPLCLKCMIQWIERTVVPGRVCSVDVAT